jgi:hypothetical protein
VVSEAVPYITSESSIPFSRSRPLSSVTSQSIPPPSIYASSTPSASMSISIGTPHSDVPSICSGLDIASHARSEILSHDINRLLQHIHALDQVRGEENRDVIDNIRAMRDDLGDLSDWLRNRDIPPPLPPKKEQSIGARSVALRKMTPISLAPPSLEQIPGSPSSMSSGLSFLSSLIIA